MRVVFIGVGEAFDEALPNTSLLVAEAGEGQRTILLDCGFTAAAAYFACPALSETVRERGPDAVWLSHFHGDHYFGLPYAVARWQEAGRQEPLVVVGGEGVVDKVTMAVDLAYPGLRAKLGFPLQPVAVRDGESFLLAGCAAQVALTGHGAPCLALRLEMEGGAVYYSGDGAPTESCRGLARGCRLLVQEAYGLESGRPGHGSVEEALSLAAEAGAGQLAITHVRREFRREHGADIRQRLAQSRVRAFMPEPGTVFGDVI